jgi:hypothetical protein
METEEVWIDPGDGPIAAIYAANDRARIKFMRRPVKIKKSEVVPGMYILDHKLLKLYNSCISAVDSRKALKVKEVSKQDNA